MSRPKTDLALALILALARTLRHDGPVNAASHDLPRHLDLLRQSNKTLLILSTTLLLALPGPAAQFYLSTTGSDINPGTSAKPFATLERARDEVRQLKQDGKLPKGGLTIWLRGGDYLRTHALQLTAADSGTPDAPNIWCACKGENVRLLGGRKLAGFQPVTDTAILARLTEVDS